MVVHAGRVPVPRLAGPRTRRSVLRPEGSRLRGDRPAATRYADPGPVVVTQGLAPVEIILPSRALRVPRGSTAKASEGGEHLAGQEILDRAVETPFRVARRLARRADGSVRDSRKVCFSLPPTVTVGGRNIKEEKSTSLAVFAFSATVSPIVTTLGP